MGVRAREEEVREGREEEGEEDDEDEEDEEDEEDDDERIGEMDEKEENEGLMEVSDSIGMLLTGTEEEGTSRVNAKVA